MLLRRAIVVPFKVRAWLIKCVPQQEIYSAKYATLNHVLRRTRNQQPASSLRSYVRCTPCVPFTACAHRVHGIQRFLNATTQAHYLLDEAATQRPHGFASNRTASFFFQVPTSLQG